MNRRYALKSLVASFGTLLTLPAWANNWNSQSILLESPFLSVPQADLLTEIVTTIIPEGEKPGAKSLGVPLFIEKMVADCFEPKNQADFKLGLEAIERLAQQTHNQAFVALTTVQKAEILRGVAHSTDVKQKDFFTQLKNLTIQGYTTSEYVMVNHLKYEMAPAHYYGCVPV